MGGTEAGNRAVDFLVSVCDPREILSPLYLGRCIWTATNLYSLSLGTFELSEQRW